MPYSTFFVQPMVAGAIDHDTPPLESNLEWHRITLTDLSLSFLKAHGTLIATIDIGDRRFVFVSNDQAVEVDSVVEIYALVNPIFKRTMDGIEGIQSLGEINYRLFTVDTSAKGLGAYLLWLFALYAEDLPQDLIHSFTSRSTPHIPTI